MTDFSLQLRLDLRIINAQLPCPRHRRVWPKRLQCSFCVFPAPPRIKIFDSGPFFFATDLSFSVYSANLSMSYIVNKDYLPEQDGGSTYIL